MYHYGIKSYTIPPTATATEIAVKSLTMQCWNHFRLVQDGITTFSTLGYSTIDNELPAFWVDTFSLIHRLDSANRAEKK